MSAAENHAGRPQVGSIRFQPLLPQPAHPLRALMGWGVPALVVEGLAVLGLVWITARGGPAETEQVTTVRIVEVPPEVALPKPPPPPELPASAAVTRTSEPPAQVEGFQELAMPTVVLAEIPEPPALGTVPIRALDFTGEGAPGGRGLVQTEAEAPPLEAAPTFTPYTVAPFLKNGRDVARTLSREYPPQLRSAAIGGRVLLWLFIDDTGTVEETVLKTSSGFEALDAAAMRIAMTMEFSPAINRDRKVPVWVAIPVDFAVD
jgi:protein TonB